MSFDALAPHYRWMEFVLAGSKLQRCRTAFLDQVAGARQLLLAGEGNGRFLAACRAKLPRARMTVLDASVRMLEAARRRLKPAGGGLEDVEFVLADARDWRPPEPKFDLIVTHFFLDCFPPRQLGQVIRNLARAARPGAAWLLADFQVPRAGLRRWRAQGIHALMYAFFRVATRLPARRWTSPDAFLQAQGFQLMARQTREWDLLRTDWWAHAGRAESPPAANARCVPRREPSRAVLESGEPACRR